MRTVFQKVYKEDLSSEQLGLFAQQLGVVVERRDGVLVVTYCEEMSEALSFDALSLVVQVRLSEMTGNTVKATMVAWRAALYSSIPVAVAVKQVQEAAERVFGGNVVKDAVERLILKTE